LISPFKGEIFHSFVHLIRDVIRVYNWKIMTSRSEFLEVVIFS